jgi:transposase
VLVVRRPKYACRMCEDVVVQTPAPARLIEGGLPTEATIAHVLVSKYVARQSGWEARDNQDGFSAVATGG